MTGNEFPARERCLRPEQYALAQQQRIKAERIGLELTRALATAVDAELRSSMSVVQSLATSISLDRNDLSNFQEHAQRVLETQPNWAAVFLADPSGQRFVDVRFRYGTVLPPILEKESFDREHVGRDGADRDDDTERSEPCRAGHAMILPRTISEGQRSAHRRAWPCPLDL